MQSVMHLTPVCRLGRRLLLFGNVHSTCSWRSNVSGRKTTALRAAPLPQRRRMAAPAAAAAAAAVPAAAPGPTKFSAALTEIDVGKYEQQLEAKIARIRAQFAEFNAPELVAFRSQPQHYRMRSEFRVWHDKEELYYIMFEKGENGEQRQVRVDQFPVASELINQLMEIVMREARQCEVLRAKLYQVNFHTTLNGQAMVTLIYHKKLGAQWEAVARQLQEALAAAPASTATPHVIGRSRGQKVVLGKDEVEECLEVDGQQLKYIQVEASFSQPNAGTCCNMLSWARRATAGCGGHDLLELYCGNGNFTVALAPNFRKVVATEVSKSGVSAAKRNCDLNGAGNVFVARVSSEDFTQAWKEGRTMQRLQGLDLASCRLQTLLVDPPRAGLDDRTVHLLRDFQSVVYISCNPDTLHRDLLAVKDAFDIKRFALFDQFPYTHHIECGVYLERKGAMPAADGASEEPAAAAAGAAGEGAVGAAAAAAPASGGGSGARGPSAGDPSADGEIKDSRGMKRKFEGE